MITVGRTVDYIVGNANVRRQELKGRTVIAYPDTYISSPLKETVYALGIKSVTVSGRELDANGTVITPYQRCVYTTYFLNVYSPHEMGGDECIKGFDRWMNFLVKTIGINIESAGSDGMDYIQTIGSNVFKGYFVTKRTVLENQDLNY